MAYDQLWQYQTLTEPVFVPTVETVTIASWFQQTVMPGFNRPQTYLTSVGFVMPFSAATTQFTKFIRRHGRRLRAKKQSV